MTRPQIGAWLVVYYIAFLPLKRRNDARLHGLCWKRRSSNINLVPARKFCVKMLRRRRPSMHRWIRPLFPSLAALCCFALPLAAESISGTLSADSTLTPSGTPGVYIQNLTGNGTDSLLGSFTVASMSTADFSHPPAITITSGTFTETFAGGTLFGTSSGDGTASGHGTATTGIDLLFTGGTGKFGGVTGEATFTGTVTQTSPTTQSLDGNYVGTLTSFPEPSGLPIAALISLIVVVYSLAAPRLRQRHGRRSQLRNS